MAKLQFQVDAERITLGELIDVQDGQLAAMRDMLAHCLVREDGTYVEYAAAQRVIGDLKLSEVRDTVNQFMEQLQAGAVNPPKDGSS